MKQGKIKVAIGLSGGVDSAVSANLLLKAGYEVVGIHLVCWDEGPQCRARKDRQDALKVALKLGIPLRVLDFQKEYRERVIERFYQDYERGLTPNPDVLCNSEIKFGLFLDWALENGFDFVATGHYAKVSKNDEGKFSLLIPFDKHKDQTYFLYKLKQQELSHILFPLSDYQKSEVRKMALDLDLPVASKPDSQGICFVGDVDVQEFLRRRLKEVLGEVVDSSGEVIGEHKGIWFYTIGQRGGWMPTSDFQKRFAGELPAFYVTDKNVEKNQLVVGFGAETYKDELRVRDYEETGGNSLKLDNQDLWVRIRHGGELLRAAIKMDGDNNLRIELFNAQRGIAPGQAAVLYTKRGEEIECIGGGVIS